jgi:hypothetical protein
MVPIGCLVLSGLEPPENEVFTMRLKSAQLSLPFEPAVSLLIHSIIRRWCF